MVEINNKSYLILKIEFLVSAVPEDIEIGSRFNFRFIRVISATSTSP